MKIPRYTQARTTVGQLESGRAALRTPAQAAAAKAVPYKAISDVAGIAGEAVEAFDLARKARQFEDDKITFAIGEANRDAAYKVLIKDPDLENKMAEDPEYFTTSVQNIQSSYLRSLDDIKDDRTRERFKKKQAVSLINFKATTEADLGIYETKVSKNRAYEAGAVAELAGDWDSAETIYDASKKYFNPAEEAQQAVRIQNGRNEVQANSIADDVIAAYEKGGKEWAMNVLQAVQMDDELPDDVQKMALARGNLALSNRMKVDATERGLYEQRLKEESSKRRIAFEQAITIETNNKVINDFADAEDLTHAERRQLFNLREKKANALTSFKIANPNTKQYRDGLDEITQSMRIEDENGDPMPLNLEQQYAVQIGMLGLEGDDQSFGIGSNLTSTMVKAAASDDEETYTQGLRYYADIMQQNPKTKLDFGDTDTFNFYEAAHESAQRMGGKPEDYAIAAKEQQAIHITKAQGLDSIHIADSKFKVMKDVLLTDVGDALETMGIDIPGVINDAEFQYDGQFQVAYLENARDITRYMEATEGTVDPSVVKRRALQRTLAHINPNFMNAGVPTEDRQFFTEEGLQEESRIRPQLSINVLDGAEDQEGADHLRSLAQGDYVEGGVGLNNKKVIYQGRPYTLISRKGGDPSALGFGMEGSLELEAIGKAEKVIYIDSIEFFTGVRPRTDENGVTTADLRYMGMPIYDAATGKNVETWNRFTEEDYIRPEDMTDISGGVTREDINPRINK